MNEIFYVFLNTLGFRSILGLHIHIPIIFFWEVQGLKKFKLHNDKINYYQHAFMILIVKVIET